MIACVLLPFLSLRAALGRPPGRLSEPVAVAPEEGGPSRIGEVSPAARAFGVRPGMQLGEAVDICPVLALVPPDPVRAEAIHDRLLVRLESVGAAVESERPGEAFFRTEAIERMHGGLPGVLAACRRATGPEPVLTAAPTRLAALALALESDPAGKSGGNRPKSGGNRPGLDDRPGEPPVLPPGQLHPFLAGLPVTILSGRLGFKPAPEREFFRATGRLGLNRLGDLTALSADQVADRFGPAGSLARKIALGEEGRIRPRRFRQAVTETVELPEDATGNHLPAGLAILCDRVASRLAAAGTVARSLSFEADLVEGGSWSREFTPRRPTASSPLLKTLLAPVPEQLPRPAGRLRLRVTATAPSAPEQMETAPRPEETRRIRLDEAARQVRAAVGEAGLMRVLEAESGSRLPERRVFLTPYLSE